MPAIYAHDRFGREVASKLSGEIKEIIKRYYTQFQIGLQGPDILFFYRPFYINAVAKYGIHLHHISAYPFFEHAVKVVKKRGRNSREYAYLLGFICHYALDSECHPYVSEMMKKTKVAHMEIEAEYEKMLLRMDGENPFSYPVADLVPADEVTARAIAPFYEKVNEKIVQKSLLWLRFVKRLFTAKHKWKHDLINLVLKLAGQYHTYNGLLHQRIDNEKCVESSLGLLRRMHHAVEVAEVLMQDFDACVQGKHTLGLRFDRNFE